MFRQETNTQSVVQVPSKFIPKSRYKPVQFGNSHVGLAMRWFYAFFFLSGFCGILYELVWLRLAMARFGVTIFLTATFLSVFMSWIGLGSWSAGRWLCRDASRLTGRPIILYAATELLIGISAFLVPYELLVGHAILLRLGNNIAWTSLAYSCFSGICLAVSLAPSGAFMGATFLIALSDLRATAGADRQSFGYQYLGLLLAPLAE